jgi:hypothetical protein
MTKRTESFRSALALAAAAVAVGMLVDPTAIVGQPPAAAPAKGKAEKAPPGPVPRTKEGKPDMSGFWGGVTPGGNVDIEPAAAKGGGAPPGGAKGAAPGGGKGGPGAGPGAGPGGGKGAPPEAAAGAGKGAPPAAPAAAAAKGKAKGVIIDPPDARVPYNAAARAKSNDIIANRMFLEPELHCFPSGVPHNMWVQFGMQAVQNKDYLVFMWEFMHSRRIIPLDGRPHTFPPSVRQMQGESVGHWEGDTLVVSTINQTDKTWFDTSGHYAPKDIDVVERFTMINADQIRYEATVTSPTEFTQPMRLAGMMSRANQNDPTYEQMEFACIEGNKDLEHYTQDKGGKAKYTGPLVTQ